MTSFDVNALANAKAKGKRPYFFDDPAVERVLGVTMAVAGEARPSCASGWIPLNACWKRARP